MSAFPKSGPFESQDAHDEASDLEFDDEYASEQIAESDLTSPYGGSAAGPTADTDDPLEDVANSATLSVVGSTLVFRGDLIADEDLLVQGRVHGTIEHNADNLTIGVHGRVKADIRARNILVQGEVNGNMYATERVIVESSARVTGDIFSPAVGLKEGAKFKGSIDMDGMPDAAAHPVPKAAIDTASESVGKRKSRRRGPKKSATTPGDEKTVSDSVVDATLSEGEAPTKAS